ncbi:MFS transporter [Croceicoccus marinus]|uniref:MFS transporter n=1 Tax=Croceicoccus marinus TaxID=450378 RepID=A0A1Z1F8F9_9SPHN|nr:MFS transporter [Croceicoccus marinus]ARU15014.1 MFS transporter [Croceicoccus marinus]
MREGIDDGERIQRPTRFRWMVLGLIFLLYSIAAADRANIGIVLPSLSEEFGLSKTQAGALASLFFIAYAAGQVPAGFLIKRMGVRKVLPISLILTSVFTACHAFANSVFALKSLRVLLGFSEAPIAAASVTSVNNWFPKKEKGTAAGIFFASTKAGPAIVPFIGGIIIAVSSWHWVFLAFAIPGILLPFIWLALVPDRPGDSRHVNAAEAELIESDDASLRENGGSTRPARSFPVLDKLIRAREFKARTASKEVFRTWSIWGASLGYFLFVGIMNVILAWLPTYLAEERGLSIVSTGLLASMPFVGAVIGNVAGGLISDRVFDGRRKPVMMFSCLMTTVVMIWLMEAPENPVALALVLSVTGFLIAIGFSQYAIYTAGLTSKAMFPIATGILNTLGQLGGAALPFVAGMILDASTWTTLFALMASLGVAAFVILATITEPLRA